MLIQLLNLLSKIYLEDPATVVGQLLELWPERPQFLLCLVRGFFVLASVFAVLLSLDAVGTLPSSPPICEAAF